MVRGETRVAGFGDVLETPPKSFVTREKPSALSTRKAFSFQRAMRGSNARPSVPEEENRLREVVGNLLKMNSKTNNSKDLQIIAMSRFVT
jgi:hypothetical protein